MRRDLRKFVVNTPEKMDVQAYLNRIGYEGLLSPTYETLRGLQVAHMHSVPFENLDIVPLHRPIRLDAAALWDKIVVRKRGGFCYELNGLFASLLNQLGYRVTHLNARVFNREGKLGIEFDHLALLVSLPDDSSQWLADVGFGDSFEEPLLFRDGEQEQGSRAYRLERNEGGYITWQRDYDGTWKREYFFDLTPRTFPAEYEDRVRISSKIARVVIHARAGNQQGDRAGTRHPHARYADPDAEREAKGATGATGRVARDVIGIFWRGDITNRIFCEVLVLTEHRP